MLALLFPSEKHFLRTFGTKESPLGLAMRQHEMPLVFPFAGADFPAKLALCFLVMIVRVHPQAPLRGERLVALWTRIVILVQMDTLDVVEQRLRLAIDLVTIFALLGASETLVLMRVGNITFFTIVRLRQDPVNLAEVPLQSELGQESFRAMLAREVGHANRFWREIRMVALAMFVQVRGGLADLVAIFTSHGNGFLRSSPHPASSSIETASSGCCRFVSLFDVLSVNAINGIDLSIS